MAKHLRYSEEFKEKAVAMFLQSNLSAAQVAKNLGVHSHTLCNWIKQYKNCSALSIETVTDKAFSFRRRSQSNNANIEQITANISEIQERLNTIKGLIMELYKN